MPSSHAPPPLLDSLRSQLHWNDTRLKPPPGDDLHLDPDTVWVPKLVFTNQMEEPEVVGRDMKITEAGTVSYRRRVKVALTQSFKRGLVHYPFDHHGLDVLLESYGYGADEVFIIPLLNATSAIIHDHNRSARHPMRRDLRNTPLASESGSWDIYSFDMYAEVRPSINYERDNFYVGRMYIGRKFFMPFMEIVFPLVLTVLLSLGSLLFRLQNVDVRSNMVAIGVFTSLMYIYVIKADLPPISFLTWTHYYMIICLIFIGAATVEVIMCHYLDPSGEAASQAEDEEMDRLAGNTLHIGGGGHKAKDPFGDLEKNFLEFSEEAKKAAAKATAGNGGCCGKKTRGDDDDDDDDDGDAATKDSGDPADDVDTDNTAAAMADFDDKAAKSAYDNLLRGTHHDGARAHTVAGKRMLATFDFIDIKNDGFIDADDLILAIETMNVTGLTQGGATNGLSRGEAVAVIMKTKEHFSKISAEVRRKEFGAGIGEDHGIKASGNEGEEKDAFHCALSYDEFVWAVEHEVIGLQDLAKMRTEGVGKKCCCMNETHVPAFDRVCQVILPLLFFIFIAVMICVEIPNITYKGPKSLDILKRKENMSPEYKGLITD